MGVPTTSEPAVSALSKLWIASALPFHATTAICLPYTGEGIVSAGSNYHPNGVTGTRSRPRETRRRSGYTVGGSVTLTPSFTQLQTLLPLILGGAIAGSGTSGAPYTFALAETLPQFQLLQQKILGSLAAHPYEIYLNEGCVVANALFQSTQNSALTLTLSIEARRQTPYADGALNVPGSINTGANVVSSGANVPSSVPDNDTCFMHYDTGDTNGSMRLGGTDRVAFDWSLAINNFLDTGRFGNSKYRWGFPANDREVVMSATLPFSASEALLYDVAVNSASPDMNDNTITFYAELGTNDDVLEFQIGTWQPLPSTPVANGKNEYLLALAGPVDRKNTATAKPELAARLWRT